MFELTPYSLALRSGLHIGTRGINLEEAGSYVPSDTLFAALVDAWRRAGGDAAGFAAPFAADPPAPPFLLTSAFPYAGAVRFYPMPANLGTILGEDTLRPAGKAIRRIGYLSEALLAAALGGGRLDGEMFPADVAAEPDRGAALQGGSLWLSLDEAAGLPAAMQRRPGKRHALRRLSVWSTDRVTRVTVDRIGSAANIYQAGRVTFAADCGLWFGVAWVRPDAEAAPGGVTYRQAFDRALGVLQDEGLGGERSTGYGAFSSRTETPVKFDTPQAWMPALLLSRYHPRSGELPGALTGEGAAYGLVTVGGWLATPGGPAQRRKRLCFVREGSIVCPPAYPAGDVVDVRPAYENPAGDVPHPVYRYGLALALPWPSAPAEQGQEAHHA